MTESRDPLAEAIRVCGERSQKGEKAAARYSGDICAHLLEESRHLGEDMAVTALSHFCRGQLLRLLAQHGHAPSVCAKVVRSNFYRLFRWRQRDEWRREARRLKAEWEFTSDRVREAYEGDVCLEPISVLREVAALDAPMAEALKAVRSEARSCDEIYGHLAPVLRCSKATARRRLLGLGQRLRGLMRRDVESFVSAKSGLCLPSAKGVCAARVVKHVMASSGDGAGLIGQR